MYMTICDKKYGTRPNMKSHLWWIKTWGQGYHSTESPEWWHAPLIMNPHQCTLTLAPAILNRLSGRHMSPRPEPIGWIVQFPPPLGDSNFLTREESEFPTKWKEKFVPPGNDESNKKGKKALQTDTQILTWEHIWQPGLKTPRMRSCQAAWEWETKQRTGRHKWCQISAFMCIKILSFSSKRQFTVSLKNIAIILTDIKSCAQTPKKNTAFLDVRSQSASVAADGSGWVLGESWNQTEHSGGRRGVRVNGSPLATERSRREILSSSREITTDWAVTKCSYCSTARKTETKCSYMRTGKVPWARCWSSVRTGACSNNPNWATQRWNSV